jgi:molecular chaperone GrpE
MSKEKEDGGLHELKNKLEAAEKLAQDYLAGWKRAKADLINYNKEKEEEAGKLYYFMQEYLVLELLPVLDSFDEALKASHDKEGIEKIREQLWSVLSKEGLKAIDKAGIPFDPNIHESVGEVPGEHKNIVAEVIQKGYLMHGHTIRPACVKIVS